VDRLIEQCVVLGMPEQDCSVNWTANIAFALTLPLALGSAIA
jgi:hypothetical protein